MDFEDPDFVNALHEVLHGFQEEGRRQQPKKAKELLDVIDFDESLGETIVIEEPTDVKESFVVIEYDVSEESMVIEKVCEDEEVDEITFIYKAALWYEPDKGIDNISLLSAETGEEDEVPKNIADVTDLDGKEEVSEEINFVTGDIIVENVEEEINIVDTNEVVEKEVQKPNLTLLTSEMEVEKVEESEDVVVVQKVTKVEQLVREEYPKANLPMEYQGTILSNEVACHCDPKEAKEMQNLVGESLKMGVDRKSSNTYVVPSPKKSSHRCDQRRSYIVNSGIVAISGIITNGGIVVIGGIVGNDGIVAIGHIVAT
ncbi:unnamed protein product [Lactuca virosa]|uniref:Uncharacterized protein n=1 Tax=Lactuca virosa TaxID=75947 RepID=A0AAU9N497_9ASTR|nr:unnamed protein product [Lactuca virosa]